MLKSMLTHAREVREIEGEAADAGFTLIELMVVLLIIAILLAIAIPTFLGVTGSANDRASQSNLTNALTEAKALFQNNSQSYGGLTAATFSSSAPEFTWGSQSTCAAGSGVNCVSFTPVDVALAGDGAGIVLANLSKTGTCWYLMTLEATPVATFATPDVAPAYQAATGSGAVGDEGVTTAGTYYSKSTAVACNATTPLTHAGGWTWGSTYSNAPAL